MRCGGRNPLLGSEPYSYFGGSAPAVLCASTTYGLLVVVWWFCFSALDSISPRPRMRGQMVLEGSYFVVGLSSLLAMAWTGLVAARKASLAGYDEIVAVVQGKTIATFVFIGVGASLFGYVSKLRARVGLLHPPEASPGGEERPGEPVDDEVDPDVASASPECIVMQGLPLHLSGWNGAYQREESGRRGRCVWRRPEHWFKKFVPLRIIGVRVFFDGSAWVLHRDCDPEGTVMWRSSHAGETPIGEWERGVSVREY